LAEFPLTRAGFDERHPSAKFIDEKSPFKKHRASPGDGSIYYYSGTDLQEPLYHTGGVFHGSSFSIVAS
jgi:hypothetical protein